MFNKILIANRGEIACRVIKTAKSMGIQSVAVFSDADRDALHVRMADEAVHIGASAAQESYLDVDKIINAAIKTGAQAIHPGYGFLSENATLAEQCVANNIVFIGPPVNAIKAMGSKSAAKNIMSNVDVPLVPGYHGDDQDLSVLKGAADEMGYPVLLKAVAGGGGKGMRQVWSSDEFESALKEAKSESMASFADDVMLVEKYLTQPRHVEIQVFCDGHGNGVYLFERDCSIQRRHQKVIEEAPAPNLTDEIRQAMGEAAVRAAHAIDYEGAGTVEFLFDTDGSFYFMEMNTRLQVEHPVTEMITGEDLVEWQLRVANGEPLPKTQQQLSYKGHSFEARIYAEDPDNDFLPTSGKLEFLQNPKESDYVRVDTGIEQGDEISPFYDPMIAKLIVWGEDRAQALTRMQTALKEFRVFGVTTNIAFLQQLFNSDSFAQAKLDTGFIEKNKREIFKSPQIKLDASLTMLALHQVLSRRQDAASNNPWHTGNAFRMNQLNQHHFDFEQGDSMHSVVVEDRSVASSNNFKVTINEAVFDVAAQLNDDCIHTEIDGHSQEAMVATSHNSFRLFTDQGMIDLSLSLPDYGDSVAGGGAGDFCAPMNGTVVELLVEKGAKVNAGDALLVLEAMKMQNTIVAPAEGIVTDIFFSAGELVSGGDELLSFEVS